VAVLVVDASAIAALLFVEPEADAVAERLREADLSAPQLLAYELANVSVGRDFDSWSVKLWAQNLLDEEYFVRGFYFGNEPPDFAPKLYTRLGDPRQYGVTLSYRL